MEINMSDPNIFSIMRLIDIIIIIFHMKVGMNFISFFVV